MLFCTASNCVLLGSATTADAQTGKSQTSQSHGSRLRNALGFEVAGCIALQDQVRAGDTVDGANGRHSRLTSHQSGRINLTEGQAKVGLQEEKFGNTGIWLLPNPSGLNANYQLADFIDLFKQLKAAVEEF